MKNKRKDLIALFLLILALLILNYPFLEDLTSDFLDSGETAHIERVIDGDTIVSNGTSIRLLGINSPERGEYFYQEAKDYLEERVLNQTVNLEFTKERYDKYKRILAYIFIGNNNINIELVEKGYANYYFYDRRDKYSNALEDAWEKCIENNVNLCEKSVNICSSCININRAGGSIVNTCSFSCDINGWEMKGEGRGKFVFSEILSSGQSADFELEVSDSGGALFLRDDGGLLVDWRKL